MTFRELIKDGENLLAAAGIENAAYDSRRLFEEAFGVSGARMLLMLENEAGAELSASVQSYRSLLKRRASRVPLQYITGSTCFMGFDFRVSEDVLIPRQDTETLVETVLENEREPEAAVLDMCTGSGCIAVSLKLLGGYRSVTAADKFRNTLEIAASNAVSLGADIVFVNSDLFDAVEGDFDVIVSNPPYIRKDVIDGLEPEVRAHEPVAALDGGCDGLDFYRRITAEAAGGRLKSGGRLYYEIGYDQGQAVSELLKDNGFADIRVIKDLAGLDRVVCGTFDGGVPHSVRHI